MKRNKIIFTLLLLLDAAFLYTAQANEPKFVRDAFCITEDGEEIAIPASAATYTMVLSVNVKGPAAKARIPKADEIHIIIKAKNIDDTPGEIFKAFKLKQGKDKRTASMGGMGIHSKDMIPFEATTYGDHCYELVFTGLERGEYGIWYSPDLTDLELGEHQMTFFGID